MSIDWQATVGSVFVAFGLVLFVVQVIYALAALVGKPRLTSLDSATAGALDKLIAALTEKFPVAALAIASVWLGGQILGWFQ